MSGKEVVDDVQEQVLVRGAWKVSGHAGEVLLEAGFSAVCHGRMDKVAKRYVTRVHWA